MKTEILIPIFALTFLVLTLHFASALVVNANYITVYPGEQGNVKINVENDFSYDIEDVFVSLNLENLPFSAIGSSEKKLDDLNEDDDDSATFALKVSTDAVPQDYDIPYTIRYTNSDTDEEGNQSGTFGIRISAKTEIDFSADKENAIVGSQGKISLKIINKGLGEIKFVSVQIFPQGYTLLSSDKVYIGNIASDDSDFASFDVVFDTSTPTLSAVVTYKDFDNKDQSETVTIPIEAYTRDEALKLGLIQQSRTGLYIGIIIVIAIIWFIWRRIKKRRKNKQRGGI
jgi:hypothetical protein